MLRYGLQAAVEAKVLADVNGTSGIQSQTYATSVLTTLRKGITRLEVAGYSPAAFALHPTDFEGVELALSAQNAIEHLGLPYNPANRQLYGVPVVTANAQAAGVGHVFATDSVALDTGTRGVDVQYSENATADSFGKNLVFDRCERRYVTSVFSPLGVVSLDLTAQVTARGRDTYSLRLAAGPQGPGRVGGSSRRRMRRGERERRAAHRPAIPENSNGCARRTRLISPMPGEPGQAAYSQPTFRNSLWDQRFANRLRRPI